LCYPLVGMATKKKKGNALAAAASKRLARIGARDPGGMSPEDLAHTMFHAEQDGRAERVPTDDGGWAWQVMTPEGPRLLKPTPEVLDALAQIEQGDHHHH